MKELFKNNPSYVVSEAALEKKGHFSADDIIQSVKLMGANINADKAFVIKKLDAMCEFGLIGKTSMYYFSVNS